MANGPANIQQVSPISANIQRDVIPELPDFERGGGKGDGAGMAGELRDLAAQASRRQAERHGTVRIDAFAATARPMAAGDAASLTPLARKLAEARQLMSAGQHAKALPLIRDVLREQPAHVEAVYLGGCCLLKLDKPMDALRALRLLRGVRLDGPTDVSVQSLREDIRGALFSTVIVEHLILVETGQHDRAAAAGEELVELDGGKALWHQMVVHTYLEAGRPDAAWTALRRGLEEAKEDAAGMAGLRGLSERVGNRLAADQMTAARDLYKQGRYGPARAALDRLGEPCRGTKLYASFHAYLGRLAGGGGGFLGLFRSGGRKPADVAPEGEFAEVDALHFFLVRQEMDRGSALLEAGQFAASELQYAAAVGYAPHFPYAHHRYAYCIYRKTFASFQSSGGPAPLDEVLADMTRALPHAKLAVPDPDIKQAALLVEAIEGTLTHLGEVRARRDEAKPINAAIEEFVAIMKAAKGGVSPENYADVRRRLERLRGTVRDLGRTVRSPEGRTAIKDLAEAAERNWKQLDALKDDMAEAATVEACWGPFKARMESLSAGGRVVISSRAEAQSLKDFLRKTRKDAEAARGRVRGESARKALDALVATTGQLLGQMDG